MKGSASIFSIFSHSKLCSLSHTHTPMCVSSLSDFNTFHFSLGHLMADSSSPPILVLESVLTPASSRVSAIMSLFPELVTASRNNRAPYIPPDRHITCQPTSFIRNSKLSYFVPFLWAPCVAPFCESRTRLFSVLQWKGFCTRYKRVKYSLTLIDFHSLKMKIKHMYTHLSLLLTVRIAVSSDPDKCSEKL